MYRRVCEQTSADGAHTDLYTAGMVKMDFIKYTISSTLGIFLWNLVFVGAGYFFGEAAIRVLA